MTSSAFIAHLMDPLVDPYFVDQERSFERAFSKLDDRGRESDRDRTCLRNFKRSSTYALDWSGDQIMAATKDNFLRLYDPEQGEVSSWPGEWMAIQSDPNNPYICAAVSWNGKFKVFDTRTQGGAGTVYDVDLKKTTPHMKDFLVLCWAPDSKHIAVNNRQDQVYILDLRLTGSLRLGASRSMANETNQMVYSTDGSTLWLATGGSPGKLTVLPAPTLQNEGGTQLVAHQYTTVAVAADPEGRHIASAGCDCLVGLWDPKHLVCTRTFGYATQPVSTLSFNHTGSLLAWGTGGAGSSGGGEKNLTIVGASTNLYWQEGTAAPVTQVRWHPKRNTLAYSLVSNQLPDERDMRRMNNRELRESAVVQILNLPNL
mmetsp:Transcript_10604/g.17366  ORF Transcript_10604/g.17366 Transcript_10604/m.17366 type:complete len:372 (+) Transcript_10604:96-1211(+)